MMTDFKTQYPAQEQSWETRRTLEQLAAVIGSAIELDVFDTSLEGDFERVRVLLELSRDLAGQTVDAAKIWEELTAELEHSIAHARLSEPLSPVAIMELLKGLVNYLREGSSKAYALAEVASAIALHGKNDQAALQIVAFVIGELRHDGIQADLMNYPDAPRVEIWDDGTGAVSAAH